MESFWEREAAESRLRSRDKVGPWVMGFDPGGAPSEESLVVMRRVGDHHEVRLVPPLDSGSNAQVSALRRYWTSGPGSEPIRWPRHRENPSQSPWSPQEEWNDRSGGAWQYVGRHRKKPPDWAALRLQERGVDLDHVCADDPL